MYSILLKIIMNAFYTFFVHEILSLMSLYIHVYEVLCFWLVPLALS